MSANHTTRPIEDPFSSGKGLVWHRLHAEREDICEALLKERRPSPELLQARLRKVDDALDRLMAGSYGCCSKCGKWIEDTKLEFDPAIAFCLDCWDHMGKH